MGVEEDTLLSFILDLLRKQKNAQDIETELEGVRFRIHISSLY
jgi:hypothetical protein